MPDNNKKSEKNKIVDVIIPFHNEEDYLERCLSALKNQNYIHKIIGINDYSTDNSIEICKKFNIHVIDMEIPLHQRKSELADNLNLGLKNSDSKYILKLDADIELINSNYVEVLVDFMERKKNRKYFSVGGLIYVLKPKWLKLFNLFFTKIPRGAAKIYRAKNLRKMGGFTYNKKYKFKNTYGSIVHRNVDSATDKLARKFHFKTKFIRKVKAIHHRPSKIHFTYNLLSDSFSRNMIKLFCAIISFSPKMILEGLKYIKIYFKYKILSSIR